MSYPTTPLKSFADVQKLLDAFVAATSVPVGSAPHGEFWNTNVLTKQPMTYEEFTTGKLPLPEPFATEYQHPNILEIGNAEGSTVINMLSGSGPYWNQVGQYAQQMPRPNAPYNTADPSQELVIQLLSDWITAKCPNG